MGSGLRHTCILYGSALLMRFIKMGWFLDIRLLYQYEAWDGTDSMCDVSGIRCEHVSLSCSQTRVQQRPPLGIFKSCTMLYKVSLGTVDAFPIVWTHFRDV